MRRWDLSSTLPKPGEIKHWSALIPRPLLSLVSVKIFTPHDLQGSRPQPACRQTQQGLSDRCACRHTHCQAGTSASARLSHELETDSLLQTCEMPPYLPASWWAAHKFLLLCLEVSSGDWGPVPHAVHIPAIAGRRSAVGLGCAGNALCGQTIRTVLT